MPRTSFGWEEARIGVKISVVTKHIDDPVVLRQAFDDLLSLVSPSHVEPAEIRELFKDALSDWWQGHE